MFLQFIDHAVPAFIVTIGLIEADRLRLRPQRWATLKAQKAPRRATLRPQIPSDFRPRKNLEQIRGQIVFVLFDLVFLWKHFV